MRSALLLTVLLLASRASAGSAPLPHEPCLTGPWIMVRGANQHLADIHREIRAFLSRETGDTSPKDQNIFRVGSSASVVKELKLMTDNGGGVIMPQSPCGDRIAFGDAEAKEFMLALFERLRSLRTLPAEVWIVDPYKTLEHAQPNQPVHPTPSAGEAPASGSGDRQR